MLRQIIILLIIYLLTSLHYSKAANQDYILSIDKPADYTEGYIEIEKKSTQGNGMSVCSWMKQESVYLDFLLVIHEKPFYKHLEAFTNIFDAWITADDHNSDYIYIEDCNIGNFTSWYHVCITKNRTSFYFYLNGRPTENYLNKDNATIFIKDDNLTIKIGGGKGDIGSLYQINVYDRVLTVEDAKNSYNCKFMDGDIASWKDITSKSNDITFGNKIQLIQAPVPCPTPPPYKPINCSTGEPLEEPSDITAGEPCSSSPSGDSGSLSSPSGDSGSSSPSRDSGSSSPSRDSGSSSPYGDPGSSSPYGDPGSSLPNAGPATSSEE